MLKRLRHKMMTILLSALVLAWGMLPPGVQHAHAGGNDSTHRHDATHEVGHDDAHDHDSHGHEHAHHEHGAPAEVSLAAEDVAHVHWDFLGLEFSMPASEKPGDGTDGEEGNPAAVVQVVNRVVPPIQSSPSLDRVFFVPVCLPGADVMRDLEPVPRPSNLVSSIPLCDSARLERSGVLLA